MGHRRATRSRRVALVTVAALAVTGLASCGSHKHRAAAPTTAAPTTTSTATTSTTVRHHVRPRRRVHHRPPPPAIVAPLTGLPATAATAAQPAVVLKIDNVQAALPQTGPNDADVVYEEMVEGGLTRLAAVFQSAYPNPVGPVRSGRLTDEGIADDLNHPVLSYAGANAIFQPQLAAQPVQDVDDDTNPSLFVRNYSQAAPHNLYTDIAGLAATDSTHAPPAPLWAFRPSGARFAGAGVTPASSISIGFPAAGAQWTWNAPDGLWLRTQNGAVDVDSHGVQLSASNVIVQFIPYITSAYVSGEGSGADGGAIPEGLFTGSGTAWYLSGGSIAVGTWTRATLTSPTVFVDAAHKPVKLQPGRTWVELPEIGNVPSVTP